MHHDALATWTRPLFVSLPVKSFYFFVIYGTLEETFPEIDHQTYRSLGLPEGMELQSHALTEREERHDEFQVGSGWEEFNRESPQAAEAVMHAPTCVALRGELPDAEHLNQLRDCIGMIMFLLDHGGTAVCDVLTGNWYSSLDWRLKIFGEGILATQSLIAYHSIEQPDGRLHLYTRGMRRFARPDLSMKDVEFKVEPTRMAMIHHLANSMIAGGSIPNGHRLQFPELATSLTCQWQGSLDDPFFYNFWLKLDADEQSSQAF